jgi:transmembrane sensor
MNGPNGPDDEARRKAAADWFARMRGPGADSARDAFADWYADPANAAVYDRLVRRSEQSAFLPNSATERAARRARLGGGHAPRRLLAGGVLAAALALGGGAFLLPRLLNHRSGAEFANTRPVAAQLRLADDSAVWLEPGAALAPLGRDARRYRLLRGAARFDVAHDPAHPFAVEGGPVRVIARGTLFDLRLADGEAEVGLTRGAVDVETLRQGGPRFAIRLSPGERIRVEGDGRLRTVEAAAAGGGRLVFDNTTLESAARAFAGRPVRIVDHKIAALRITGSFAAADGLAFARAAAAMFRLSVTPMPDGSLLIGPPRK